ncbi:glycosyltransferase family 4 protein [Marinobacteraceae bacterium S3BR75-40.1]
MGYQHQPPSKDGASTPPRILLLYHCRANTGYAIETLEKIFWEMALKITGDPRNIFLCYPSYSHGYPTYAPSTFSNYIEFDPTTKEKTELDRFGNFIHENKINIIFGFDQPPKRSYYKIARRSGINKIVSYWGAPMSSLNYGIKLLLKKIEISLYPSQPDLYIFESKAMQESAYKGRGIPISHTAVCHLGIDTSKYKPKKEDQFYAHDQLFIDKSQKLVFYSGHFEKRKGVDVIVQAANKITKERDDISFILFGNQPGEERPYEELLSNKAKKHVFFGGYRRDLNKLHRSCYAGVIASTGWDSFTVSSLEMQASGLPLMVSDLPGLNEAIEDEVTGFKFPALDYNALANKLIKLADNPRLQNEMAQNAVERISQQFSQEKQIENLKRLATV